MLLYQLSRPLAYLWIKEKSGSKSVIDWYIPIILSSVVVFLYYNPPNILSLIDLFSQLCNIYVKTARLTMCWLIKTAITMKRATLCPDNKTVVRAIDRGMFHYVMKADTFGHSSNLLFGRYFLSKSTISE